jgi:Tfp pilus assembly protein PilF
VQECDDNADVTKWLAKLNLRIDEVRAFQSWCHESMRIDPRDPEPHEMLARYFETNGRQGEADEEWRVAAELQKVLSS